MISGNTIMSVIKGKVCDNPLADCYGSQLIADLEANTIDVYYKGKLAKQYFVPNDIMVFIRYTVSPNFNIEEIEKWCKANSDYTDQRMFDALYALTSTASGYIIFDPIKVLLFIGSAVLFGYILSLL